MVSGRVSKEGKRLTDIRDVRGVAVVRDDGARVLAVDLEEAHVRVPCRRQKLLVGSNLEAIHLWFCKCSTICHLHHMNKNST